MAKSFLEKLMIIGHCIQETFSADDEQEEFELEKQKETEEQKLLFNNMFARAIFILENAKPDESAYSDSDYKHPIFSYIKILGLSIQTKYIINVAYGRDRLPTLESKEFFDFQHRVIAGSTIWDMLEPIQDVQGGKEIRLNRDLVLPWPWHPLRFEDALTEIGKYNKRGAWRQDPNHDIYMLQPVGVCFVDSGNHSITAGIVKGEGSITDYRIVDMKVLYSLMYSDGINYYRTADNSIIQDVQNIEFAVIFEIGRKLCELNMSW
jgi:hypothetical protein